MCRIGVASKAAPFVEHRQLRVTTRFELRQRHVAGRRLIMATAAKFGYMASGAGRSIERRVFSVHIVLPSRRMRHGHHNLVAAQALLLADGRWCHVHVANETCSARLGGILGVMHAETLGVRRRLNNGRMNLRHGPGLLVVMAHLAVGHAKVRRKALRQVMAVHAIHHFRQRRVAQACAGCDSIVASGAIQVIALPVLEMHSVRKLYVLVLS